MQFHHAEVESIFTFGITVETPQRKTGNGQNASKSQRLSPAEIYTIKPKDPS